MHELDRALSDAAPGAQGPSILRRIASLKLTVVVIAALATAVAWSLETGVAPTWSLSGPLLLLAANLVAAIATHPVLRRNAPLLVFHVSLVAIVLLVAVGRLTYMKGSAELAVGQVFAGELLDSAAGPLHRDNLRGQRFVNAGFEIDYAPGRKRMATRNTVHWFDRDGGRHTTVIGDDTPLVLDGYRFYTTSNKGFAPQLRWIPADGRPELGRVHMPSYPVYEDLQLVEWTPPGGSRPLQLALVIDEVLIDPEAAARFRLPDVAHLEVRDGDERIRLARGEAAKVAGGTLVFEDLGTWMGYTIHYDPAMPWLLAASVLACAAMATYFFRRFQARPWNP